VSRLMWAGSAIPRPLTAVPDALIVYSRSSVTWCTTGLRLSRSLVRLCEATCRGRLCTRHAVYASEWRHMTCKALVVESALPASTRVSRFSLSRCETSRGMESRSSYVELFATRCSAAQYTSGWSKPCGESLTDCANLCRGLRMLLPPVPRLRPSHAWLVPIAHNKQRFGQRDGRIGGMQATHAGALIAHALCTSRLFTRCT
jgi:hypothetical protein